MGFWEWLSGRDETESTVYSNEEKVDSVIGEFDAIVADDIPTAKTEVSTAITALNNVNGFTEYVTTVPTDSYDSFFTGIGAAITGLSTSLGNKAADVQAYSNASFLEKLGSTFTMFSCKATEGLFSIVEDLGDGVASIGGWAVGGIVGWFDKDAGESVKKGVGSFVESEWSHDMFNFYYNSDFAKKSAFTEDSRLASATKIVSKTVGYVALTIFTAGAGSGLAAGGSAATAAGTATRAVSAATKVANVMSKVGSASTWAGTGLAFLSGVGTGTESGLRQNMTFDQAFGAGMKQGAIEGGTALFFGKVADGIASSAKAKDVLKATKNVEAAQSSLDDAIGNAKKAGETFVSNSGTSEPGLITQDAAERAFNARAGLGDAYASVDDATAALNDAKATLNTVKNASRTRNYIYNGKVSGGIYDAGYKAGNTIGTQGFVRGTATNFMTGLKAGKETISTAATKAKNVLTGNGASADTIKNRIVVSDGSAAGTAAASTASTTTKTGITETLKSIPGKAISAGKAALKSPTTWGTVVPAVGVAGTGELQSQYNNYLDKKDAAEANKANFIFEGVGGDYVDPIPTVNGNTTVQSGDGSGDDSSGDSSGSSGYYPTGGGSSDGGVSTGGGTSTGGGASVVENPSPSGDESKAQLKSTAEDTPKTTPEQPVSTTQDTGQPIPSSTESTPVVPSVAATVPATGDGTTYHTGGGYSGDGYYSSNPDTSTTPDGTSDLSPLDESLISSTSSIDEIIKGSKYTKIPTSSKPITTSKTSKGGTSSVIPIAAGLSAAAAAGIGAKAYMDRKRNNDTDDEDDDFDTEEWNGDDDAIDISYDENVDQDYFGDEDDYSYQEEQTEKYDARNNEELADLQ